MHLMDGLDAQKPPASGSNNTMTEVEKGWYKCKTENSKYTKVAPIEHFTKIVVLRLKASFNGR